MLSPIPHLVFLGLGSNMGNRLQHLTQAIQGLEERVGPCVAASSVYTSAPWGVPDQPDFFNQVVLLHSTCSARAILNHILQIETEMGRIRHHKWGQRLIDIDILFYDQEVIQEAHLTIPHPFIAQRNFVLVPLAEIAPNFQHPLLHQTIRELLEQSPDSLPVHVL